MKSPFRKGIQITISNAAIVAAGSMVANYYRGQGPQAAKLVVNLASEIIDEIEARSQPVDSTGTAREEIAEAA